MTTFLTILAAFVVYVPVAVVLGSMLGRRMARCRREQVLPPDRRLL